MNPTRTTLILIPTQFEFDILLPNLDLPNKTLVELCGFGPTVPAARAAQLCAQHQPSRMLLVGIAGSFCDQLNVGDAYAFSKVSCYGVGAGEGELHESAQEMGWPFWAGSETGTDHGEIGSTVELCDGLTEQGDSQSNDLELLTVCSAAGSNEEVARRREKFPSAVAEDMEGFAVAAACKLNGCSLSIVRGISNRAGDRDKKNWQIELALESAAKRVNEMLRSSV